MWGDEVSLEVDEPTSVVVQRGYCGMGCPIRDARWHVPIMLYWRLEKWLDRGDHKFQRLFFELFRIKQRLSLGKLYTQRVREPMRVPNRHGILEFWNLPCECSCIPNSQRYRAAVFSVGFTSHLRTCAQGSCTGGDQKRRPS